MEKQPGDVPVTFEEVVKLMERVAPAGIMHMDTDPWKTPVWDTAIKHGLQLKPEVAQDTGLGDRVRCLVVGDGNMGIALILRSRDLFETRRYGYYIQPSHDNETNPNGYEIWKSPAIKPDRGSLYWGFELLDRDKAKPASPELSLALIESLIQTEEFNR